MSISEDIIYKEEVVKKPKLANEFQLTVYTVMLAVFLLCLIFKSRDLLIMGFLDFTGVIFLYIVGFRPYINYRKSVRNPVIVSGNGIKVGNLFRAKREEIEKSVYNVSNGFLYIYTKDGRKFKISKDPSKIYIPYYSYPVNFDYIGYGKALKKIGIPFFVVRRKRLFGVEIVKGRKAYKENYHRERYERWLRKK